MLDALELEGRDPHECLVMLDWIGEDNGEASVQLRVGYKNRHFFFGIEAYFFRSDIQKMTQFVSSKNSGGIFNLISEDGDLNLSFVENRVDGELLLGLRAQSEFPFGERSRGGSTFDIGPSIKILDHHKLVVWLSERFTLPQKK